MSRGSGPVVLDFVPGVAMPADSPTGELARSQNINRDISKGKCRLRNPGRISQNKRNKLINPLE